MNNISLFLTEMRLCQYRLMSVGRFSISAKTYVRKNIEDHEPSEMEDLASINSSKLQKIIGKPKIICYYINAERFLGDTDSIALNETPRNASDHVAGCWVVIEVFIIFLIKLSFSDTTVIEGGRERKHSWDLSLLFWETRYSN